VIQAHSCNGTAEVAAELQDASYELLHSLSVMLRFVQILQDRAEACKRMLLARLHGKSRT
jgi:hypothetical protein